MTTYNYSFETLDLWHFLFADNFPGRNSEICWLCRHGLGFWNKTTETVGKSHSKSFVTRSTVLEQQENNDSQTMLLGNKNSWNLNIIMRTVNRNMVTKFILQTPRKTQNWFEGILNTEDCRSKRLWNKFIQWTRWSERWISCSIFGWVNFWLFKYPVRIMFFELFYSEKFLSSQAGLEPTTFWSPVRRSNHWAIRTQMAKRRL